MDVNIKDYLEDIGFVLPAGAQPKLGDCFVTLKGRSPMDDEDYEYLDWGWQRGYIMIFWLS